MNRFRIKPFLLYDINQHETVLQTSSSISVLKNQQMIGFLKSIEDSSFIADQDMLAAFREKYESALQFLKSQGILTEDIDLNFSVQKIYFLYNGELNGRFIPDSFDNVPIEIRKFGEVSLSDLEDSSLVVLLLNSYHTDYVKQVYDAVSDKQNIYLLTIFYYGFKYYIDNIYHADWLVPTHFDHIGIIRTTLPNTEEHLSYNSLVGAILEKEPYFSNDRVLASAEQIFLINTIMVRIYELFSVDDKEALDQSALLETLEINLSNRKIARDTAIFWELLE
ncbi:McbB family protein [Streptococcus chenjunshii]|uniref:McbB family protein n=1 Tax=Streptococcus chenjunshii TaxID=2173853 RepID=A0A372KPJ2_9STRE|nr:McbB family protein [Streptococcus chenjunshii]AXQ78541.1 McbB family protein [Streptococcus chenjunshii]RFU51997.1 McbB family protein [Streptococcus chenjunshii]RFU54189.1 McbB family protein [Streptococcus chenjunshii]